VEILLFNRATGSSVHRTKCLGVLVSSGEEKMSGYAGEQWRRENV